MSVKDQLARRREPQRKALNIPDTTELPDLPVENILAIKRRMAK